MRRAYKFRMRPTARQHARLAACLDAHRELYNAALQERRDAWVQGRTRIAYEDQAAQLTEIRVVRSDIAVWSYSSQQATLRRLNKTFQLFFHRLKATGKAGYPRFKGPGRFDSVEWPKDGDGARWHADKKRVYLRGIGLVKVTAHREVLGRVKTIQIRRQGRRWMLVLSCDDVPRNPLPPTGRQVGVDLGIANFAITSDGSHVSNPRWARSAAHKLTAAQRRFTRAMRGSNNRTRKGEIVAAQQRKIANARRDFHHKTALQLVRCYDLIALEHLAIANMIRRAKPVRGSEPRRPFLPNGGAAKTGLNRSIVDAGWGQFITILRAKAEDAGRICIVVNPCNTSTCCEACGHTAKESRATQAVFICRACGHTTRADEQAARNILRAGLALHATIA